MVYIYIRFSGQCSYSEPEANCSTTVVDPVLQPIQYPVVGQLAAPVALGSAEVKIRQIRLQGEYLD